MAQSTTLTISNNQDVVNVINDYAKSKVSLFITLVALGGIMIDAYQAAMVGFGNKYIAAQFGISQGLAATVNASVLVAALVGGLIANWVINRYGQKKAFIIGLGLCTLGAAAVAFAGSIWEVLVWRVVMGVGLGIDFPLATNAVAELQGAKQKKSSTSVNLWQMAWYVSTTIVFAVLLPMNLAGVDDPLLWRYGIFIGAVFAFIIMVLRYTLLGESATWAARTGKLELAKEILKTRYGIDVEVKADPNAKEKATGVRVNNVTAYKLMFSKKY